MSLKDHHRATRPIGEKILIGHTMQQDFAEDLLDKT